MSDIYLKTSVKLKSTRKVSYQCENCRGEFSYLYTVYGTAEKEGITYHDKAKRKQEMQEDREIVLLKAKEEIDNQISILTDSENYGYEKCPGCGYTQSWMIETERAEKRTNKIFIPMIIVSAIFGVGGIVILVNGRNVLPLCLGGLLLWGIAIGFVFWLNIRQMTKGEPKDLNKNFGTVSRRNIPNVIWSDPEIVE